MTTHSAYDGFRLHSLRTALQLPQPPLTRASPTPGESVAPTDWLERLAIWAERQPMHHRMGSYTQRG